MREDESSPLNNVVQERLAVEANEEDDWDLQDIYSSAAVDVRSSLCGNFSTRQGKCRSYGLDVPVNAVGVFRIASPGLNAADKFLKVFVPLAEVPASMLELQVRWRA